MSAKQASGYDNMHPGVSLLRVLQYDGTIPTVIARGALHHSQFANWTVDECREWSGKAAHQSLLTIYYTILVVLLARPRTRVSAA